MFTTPQELKSATRTPQGRSSGDQSPIQPSRCSFSSESVLEGVLIESGYGDQM
jgi:hypothetical protein